MPGKITTVVDLMGELARYNPDTKITCVYGDPDGSNRNFSVSDVDVTLSETGSIVMLILEDED